VRDPDLMRELKRRYGSTPDDVLAEELGVRIETVQRHAFELGLRKDKRSFPGLTTMPRWTDEQLAVLDAAYPTVPNVEIARRLKRSVRSVISKASKLGLRKSPERLHEMGRKNVLLRRDRMSPPESP